MKIDKKVKEAVWVGISAKVYKRFAFMLTPHFAPN